MKWVKVMVCKIGQVMHSRMLMVSRQVVRMLVKMAVPMGLLMLVLEDFSETV